MSSRKRKPPAVAPDAEYVGCRVMELPAEHQPAAALAAIDINPANRPRLSGLAKLAGVRDDVFDQIMPPEFLAVMTTKYWGAAGRKFGVSFLDNPAADLRDRIISHMNAWGDFANVSFAWSQSQGEVRIDRAGTGYWSYLGTDIPHIPAGQATMNLQGFTMQTPESEYHRVVRHETGHTLGFPHEHMRRQIVAKLDPQKTIDYFRRFQGWDANTVRQQVLTALEDSSIMGTPDADVVSIMCYALPASITTDGKPIPGGEDIDDSDKAFAAKLYPKAIAPSPPPVAVGKISIDVAKKTITVPADWTAIPA